MSDILNKLTGKIAPAIETHYIKFNKFTTKIHKTSSINEVYKIISISNFGMNITQSLMH